MDKNDRRDTWYEVSKSGKIMAEKLLDKFLKAIESLCKVLPEEDEDALAETVKTMNGILKKMEIANA